MSKNTRSLELSDALYPLGGALLAFLASFIITGMITSITLLAAVGGAFGLYVSLKRRQRRAFTANVKRALRCTAGGIVLGAATAIVLSLLLSIGAIAFLVHLGCAGVGAVVGLALLLRHRH